MQDDDELESALRGGFSTLSHLLLHSLAHFLGCRCLLGLPLGREVAYERGLVVLLQAQLALDALELLHEDHAALLLHDLGLDLGVGEEQGRGR